MITNFAWKPSLVALKTSLCAFSLWSAMAVAATPAPAVSSNSVASQPSKAAVISVQLISGLTGRLKAIESSFCGDFSDDEMTLIVSKGGKVFDDYAFCSSYGKATADVVTDAHGNSYILLDFGVGRGTNAVTEYLEVFPVQKDMTEYARIPLSEGAGPASRWDYDYEVGAPLSGGLTITFHLRVDGDDPIWVALPEKTRIVNIGATNGSGPVVFKSDHRVF